MRIPSPAFVALLSLSVLAGCVTPQDGALEERSRPVAGQDVLRVGDDLFMDGVPLLFGGELATPQGTLVPGEAASLAGQPVDWSCAANQCAAREVQVDVPADWWQSNVGFLEVGVRTNVSMKTWDDGRTYNVAILQDGKVLAYGLDTFYGAVALLPNPRPGNYTALIRAAGGSGPFEAVVQLESRLRDAADRELLPNLVVMVPAELSVETPCRLGDASGGCLIPAGANGCYEEEIQNGAQRCLRFSNMIANLGDGPLDMYMDAAEATALATADAPFYQRVHHASGVVTEEQVGTGFFHPHHIHLHYSQMAEYKVYALDPATGERADQVGGGRKVGFCLGDYGLAVLGLEGTWAAPAGLDDLQDCALPSDGQVELMLNPHWFDPYARGLVDQYVEIGGLEDGTYELVSTVNPAAKIRETDVHDNEASMRFELRGDQVTMLRGWSQGLCKVGGACAETSA